MTDKTKYSDMYAKWLCDISGLNNHNGKSYHYLAEILLHREFYFLIDTDANREHDGLMLRPYFADHVTKKIKGYKKDTVTNDILQELSYPCSVLEMLVGFAGRLENDIFYDPDTYDHTEEIFWLMLQNLHLDVCTDEAYCITVSKEELWDSAYCNEILNTWLNRVYSKDGFGGIFPIKNFDGDMTKIELWKQAELYFADI